MVSRVDSWWRWVAVGVLGGRQVWERIVGWWAGGWTGLRQSEPHSLTADVSLLGVGRRSSSVYGPRQGSTFQCAGTLSHSCGPTTAPQFLFFNQGCFGNHPWVLLKQAITPLFLCSRLKESGLSPKTAVVAIICFYVSIHKIYLIMLELCQWAGPYY